MLVKNYGIIGFALLFIIPVMGYAQDNQVDSFTYEINKILPPIGLTKDKLLAAHTLTDLYPDYKSSWVRDYYSVEIMAMHQGKMTKATSENDTLSQEQKNIMYRADVGKDIAVRVQYLPENTLEHNDPKEMDFNLFVHPEVDATFPGGQLQLERYLKEKGIDNISEEIFSDYQLAAVKFTVDEEGQILDPHIFWSSDDPKTDELMMETICGMPKWKPASYADGTKIRQEFAFTVGSMRSCVFNLLNIRPPN